MPPRYSIRELCAKLHTVETALQTDTQAQRRMHKHTDTQTDTHYTSLMLEFHGLESNLHIALIT